MLIRPWLLAMLCWRLMKAFVDYSGVHLSFKPISVYGGSDSKVKMRIKLHRRIVSCVFRKGNTPAFAFLEIFENDAGKQNGGGDLEASEGRGRTLAGKVNFLHSGFSFYRHLLVITFTVQ